MACPKCGGILRREVSLGVFTCETEVLVGVAPGPPLGGTPVYRPCGHTYQDGSVPGYFCGCGMGAIARCVECSEPMCMQHRQLSGGRVLCGACASRALVAAAEADRQAQLRRSLTPEGIAEAARANAAAEARRREVDAEAHQVQAQTAKLLAMPEPARKLQLLASPLSSQRGIGKDSAVFAPSWFDQVWPELGYLVSSAALTGEGVFRQLNGPVVPGSEVLVQWFAEHAVAAGVPVDRIDVQVGTEVKRNWYGRKSQVVTGIYEKRDGWLIQEAGPHFAGPDERPSGFNTVEIMKGEPPRPVGVACLHIIGSLLNGQIRYRPTGGTVFRSQGSNGE
ncbi:MAG: hypothetical protein ACOYEV_10370 [Candidatus Nanopelagicales bacterium]